MLGYDGLELLVMLKLRERERQRERERERAEEKLIWFCQMTIVHNETS